MNTNVPSTDTQRSYYILPCLYFRVNLSDRDAGNRGHTQVTAAQLWRNTSDFLNVQKRKYNKNINLIALVLIRYQYSPWCRYYHYLDRSAHPCCVVYLCCVTVLCTFVVLLCCVPLMCYCVVLLCCVTVLCTYVVLLCCVPVLCYCVVHLCCVTVLCYRLAP